MCPVHMPRCWITQKTIDSPCFHPGKLPSNDITSYVVRLLKIKDSNQEYFESLFAISLKTVTDLVQVTIVNK